MTSRLLLTAMLVIMAARVAQTEPRVLVLPFDPIIEERYGYYGGKESLLDYRNALQQMLVADLSKHPEIRVVEIAALSQYTKSQELEIEQWNDPVLASQIGSDLQADYVLIGTYGEFTREIRVDSRIVVTASAEVPPGFTVSATVGIWDDLPTAAEMTAREVVPIVTASGRLRPASKSVLFPEGDIAAYDPTGRMSPDQARLVLWINAPAPEIITDPPSEALRCDRVDLMNIPAEKQRSHTCKALIMKGGHVTLRINHRGYLPFVDTFQLSPGKAYRLEVELKRIETEMR